MKSFIERLRTLLVLGRVSNLPTVWSNLIVGWILANGPSIGPGRAGPGPDTDKPLLWVLLGGSFLYIGGMYLNDYCDSVFDARYCQTRPIPAGKISKRSVGSLAVLWLISGFACFTFFGPLTLGIALLLVLAIVVYDFHHKNVSFAPLLMGVCRCLLYLLAFSAFREFYYFDTLDGEWWNDISNYIRDGYQYMALNVMMFFPLAIPLGLYVAGITYLARGESRPDKPARWALILLLLPVAFACSTYFNLNFPGRSLPLLPVILICLLQLYWMAWLLIPLWRKSKPSIGRVVSGLLAGIVLVDMIALVPLVGPLGIVLFPLFVLALLLQRIIPAT